MSVAFLDTSVIAAIALGERGADALRERLAAFGERAASNLLEAEIRAALKREGVTPTAELLGGIGWIIPVRPLQNEITRVLDAGYVRGADCWHLATALYMAPDPSSVTFVTLDQTQRKVARALGFKV